MAALIGMARLALTSDMAVRSGSSSPARALSSSRVSGRYSWVASVMRSCPPVLRVTRLPRGRTGPIGAKGPRDRLDVLDGPVGRLTDTNLLPRRGHFRGAAAGDVHVDGAVDT